VSAIDIHKDIEVTLGPSAISCSTVTKCLREAVVIHDSEPTQTLIKDEGQTLIDEAILMAFAEEHFASVRRIASKTVIARTTVDRHLVGPLGMTMTVKHLRWDPRAVTAAERHSTPKGSRAPARPQVSETQFLEDHHTHRDFEQMWPPRDEAHKTRKRHMISSEKVMVIITWNPDGFNPIEILPKGQKFSADYYCSSLLTKVLKIARHFRRETRRELIHHADNTRPHDAKSSLQLCAKLARRVAPHLPYSPDLAPSDYFLFGDIKDKLNGLSFPSALHLHRARKQTVQLIDRLILMATFDQWVARVERCIQLDEE
jgi:hypothetical protein